MFLSRNDCKIIRRFSVSGVPGSVFLGSFHMGPSCSSSSALSKFCHCREPTEIPDLPRCAESVQVIDNQAAALTPQSGSFNFQCWMICAKLSLMSAPHLSNTRFSRYANAELSQHSRNGLSRNSACGVQQTKLNSLKANEG